MRSPSVMDRDALEIFIHWLSQPPYAARANGRKWRKMKGNPGRKWRARWEGWAHLHTHLHADAAPFLWWWRHQTGNLEHRKESQRLGCFLGSTHEQYSWPKKIFSTKTRYNGWWLTNGRRCWQMSGSSGKKKNLLRWAGTRPLDQLFQPARTIWKHLDTSPPRGFAWIVTRNFDSFFLRFTQFYIDVPSFFFG